MDYVYILKKTALQLSHSCLDIHDQSWKSQFPEMYNLLKARITHSDEYPVENTHSIIRAQTRHSDTAAQLVNKVKSIFVSKTKQANFHLNFTPPKHFAFSHGQLKYLKLKSSEFLTTTLDENIFTKKEKWKS